MAKILLIDDEESLLDIIQEILIDAGYSVIAVDSAVKGLDYMKTCEELPDLIVTDVAMPQMTGVEMIDQVRANPEWSYIPVVFLSASLTLKREGGVVTIPNSSYLRKPFEVEDLVDCIGEMM